jgi:nucleotide-binding universal stress UspA family protein
MKILLAVDDSKFSEAALQMVVSQHHPQETEVRVLHVVEPMALAMPPLMAQGYAPELDEVRKEQLKQGQELTARTAEKLRAAGFQAETDVYEGNARTEVVDLAAEWHADLIVVGSHGRKGLDRFLLGSVSEYVARHAICSVEIVRLPANQ